MSQNDFVIANQTAPNFRADLNLALQALASNSSGASAPATTYANMLWYDTSSNILKMRSEADDAWIDLGTLDQSGNTFTPAGVADLTQAQAEDDTSTVFGQVSGQRLAQATVSTLNASGSAPMYACRAWVNFNGDGTVAIRASGNVSSITDNGIGDYTVNLATALPDTNGAISATTGRGRFSTFLAVQGPNAYFVNASSVRMACGSDSTARSDMQEVYLCIFR